MHFFFAYYPYICITLLLAGLAFLTVGAGLCGLGNQ